MKFRSTRAAAGAALLLTTVFLAVSVTSRSAAPQDVGGGVAKAAPEDEIIRDVKELWSAAAADDAVKVSKYVTKASKEFSRKCVASAAYSEAADQSARSGDGVPVISSKIGPNAKDEKAILDGWLKSVRTRKYLLHDVSVLRHKGDDALVEVAYGDEDIPGPPYVGSLLLLHREGGKWKAFMTTNNSLLKEYCNSFARGEE